PSTAGTRITADSRTRTGRVTRSRAASRLSASRQASGAGRVPSAPRRRADIQPQARRSDNTDTPASHRTTIHGSMGSSAVRVRVARRTAVTAAGARTSARGVSVAAIAGGAVAGAGVAAGAAGGEARGGAGGAVAGPNADTVPASVAVQGDRSAVASGSASIRARVAVASA